MIFFFCFITHVPSCCLGLGLGKIPKAKIAWQGYWEGFFSLPSKLASNRPEPSDRIVL